MTDKSNSTTSVTDAVNALRARGVTNPEQVASSTSPEQIISTCKWWDQQTDAKPGLLVWKLRAGGVEKTNDGPEPGSKRAEMRATFDEIAGRFPEGSVTESHKRLQRRKGYDEDCEGVLIVVDAIFPSLAVRCDGCGFEVAYPFRSMLSVLPDHPPVAPRPVPAPQSMVPPEQHRKPQPHRVMARLSEQHATAGFAAKTTGGESK